MGGTGQLLVLSVGKNRTHSFALGVTNGLVHTEDQACGLRRTADRVYLDETRLPNERVHVITHALGAVDVHAGPELALRVPHA